VFAVERYNDILAQIMEEILSNSDLRTIMESRDWETLQAEIHRRRVDPTLSASSRKHMGLFKPLPWALNELVGYFLRAVHPHKPQIDPLWGLCVSI
jgi:hypothetical protein